MRVLQRETPPNLTLDGGQLVRVSQSSGPDKEGNRDNRGVTNMGVTGLFEIGNNKVSFVDPSLLLRPEAIFANKPIEAFRDYSCDDEDPIKARVRRTYLDMHTYQTADFVKRKMADWLKFDKFESTILEALGRLNSLVDESDPDVDMPNSIHAFQTAERLRKAHPDLDWLHLTGLIHDLGKVMAFYEPQWAVVGDTFPLGCSFAPSIVYRESSFQANPDLTNPKYNTKFGMYEANCGLENVTMSWGHDEYLYRLLLNQKASLPEEALYIIRFHSFYPWHSGGDYMHLCNEKDMRMLAWVRLFNPFDLYTKSDESPDVEALVPYYQSLIDKYIPGLVRF